jgi:hypothetical protein
VLSIPRLGLCNEWELLAAVHRLLRNGVEVSLQLKAFEILCVFVENAGRLLKKDDLLQQVWPDAVVDENDLNKNVFQLRKVLGGTRQRAVVHRDCASATVLLRPSRSWVLRRSRREERGQAKPLNRYRARKYVFVSRATACALLGPRSSTREPRCFARANGTSS